MVQFLNERMDLGIMVHQIDIAHRLGKYIRGSSRPIIIKFISRQVKSNIFANAKQLKISGVYLNEDLTRLNLKVLSSMRLKDPGNVEKSWSIDGKLYIKWKAGGKTELVKYANFNTWLSLPWPNEIAAAAPNSSS